MANCIIKAYLHFPGQRFLATIERYFVIGKEYQDQFVNFESIKPNCLIDFLD